MSNTIAIDQREYVETMGSVFLNGFLCGYKSHLNHEDVDLSAPEALRQFHAGFQDALGDGQQAALLRA